MILSVRISAVIVGLANTILLAGFDRSELNGVREYPFLHLDDAGRAVSGRFVYVIVAVVAGLATVDIVPRKFNSSRGSFP